MSKIEAMRKALSAESLAVLSTQAGEYPGFVVQINVAGPVAYRRVASELRDNGAIGPNGGLTLLGSALAGKLKAELLDELF